jgi:hypothetical protein
MLIAKEAIHAYAENDSIAGIEVFQPDDSL